MKIKIKYQNSICYYFNDLNKDDASSGRIELLYSI